MSYILDALRRADAERQQGQVPGLHAAPAGAAADSPRSGRSVWWWLALALLLGLAAGAALQWWPRPVVVQASAAPATAAAAAAALPPQAVPSAPEPAPVALPIVVSAAPVPLVDVKPAPPLAAAPVSAVPASQPVAASSRPLLLAALPPDQRRQLPPLVPGGSVWSDSAASRFVILDGQVLREGDTVTAGVVLERIERKTAVLRWKDQRVEVPF